MFTYCCHPPAQTSTKETLGSFNLIQRYIVTDCVVFVLLLYGNIVQMQHIRPAETYLQQTYEIMIEYV